MLKIMIQKKKNKLDSDEEEENEQNSKHDSAENIKNLNDEKYYKVCIAINNLFRFWNNYMKKRNILKVN